MGIELLLAAVVLLLLFAVFDLMVGVSNDAVNFLNSSIGARAAPRTVIILSIASVGYSCTGVTVLQWNDGGRTERASSTPSLFTMPELITIFLAVMLTDIVLLDFFNTFGLPTSTTVSIVFELLGAAVAVSLLKIAHLGAPYGDLVNYINTSKALAIILGILLSVVVAFLAGAAVQFLTRLVFTFDYATKMKRYGALWSGIAMATITYFILVKGAKSAAFIPADTSAWIKGNAWLLMGIIFAASAVIFHILLLRGVNILKPLILVGTFALALAFAANDLVNFIGVPLAGLHAYQAAQATAEPLTVTMDALAGKVPSGSWLLLLAGGVMVGTLWISKKARTVTETEVNLGRQEEGDERFESTALSRLIVRLGINAGKGVRTVMPGFLYRAVARRMDTTRYHADTDEENRPSFDLLRASVNLMVASAVVSYATAYKLPLSTTYVTFMVAMGTSFSDLAWGRESAVYRVTGVLTVVSGWFMTALAAFSVAALFATIVHFGGAAGLLRLPRWLQRHDGRGRGHQHRPCAGGADRRRCRLRRRRSERDPGRGRGGRLARHRRRHARKQACGGERVRCHRCRRRLRRRSRRTGEGARARRRRLCLRGDRPHADGRAVLRDGQARRARRDRGHAPL